MIDGHTFRLPSCELARLPDFMIQIEMIRRRSSYDSWIAFCKGDPDLISWRTFLAQDPYTKHGLTKPRGYPGDAELMDLAYGHSSIYDRLANASDIGRQIYSVTSGAPQSVSARMRIEFVAQQIREFARKAGPLSIASYAAGHGRELEHIDENGTYIAEMFAIDSDARSLSIICESYAHKFLIRPDGRSVFRLAPNDIPPVDFGYSMGLFDYLNPALGKRVLATIANSVCPGGRLLIGNLAEDAANIGYCEAVMDWWMVSRSYLEMVVLGAELTLNGRWSTSVIKHGCFYYLLGNRE